MFHRGTIQVVSTKVLQRKMEMNNRPEENPKLPDYPIPEPERPDPKLPDYPIPEPERPDPKLPDYPIPQPDRPFPKSPGPQQPIPPYDPSQGEPQPVTIPAESSSFFSLVNFLTLPCNELFQLSAGF